jgi:hypothetical protein
VPQLILKHRLFKNLCDHGGGRAASVLLHLGELECNINLNMQNTTSVNAVSQKDKAYSSLCVAKNIQEISYQWSKGIL